MEDLNGDGRPELLLAAPKASPAGRTNAGSAYVVFGKPGNETVKLGNLLSDRAGYQIDGPLGSKAGGAYAGRGLSSIGDLNGDGRPEILITAPRAGEGRADTYATGAAFVVWGQSGPITIDLQDVGGYGYKITGSLSLAGQGAERSSNGDFLAESIEPVGDVNGDGRPDLAFGAHLADANDRLNAGLAWVLYGKSDNGAVNLDNLGQGGFKVTGIDEQDQTGFDVAGAGDFNADGSDDVLISSHLSEPLGRPNSGSVYVVWGGKGLTDIDLARYGKRALRVIGAKNNDALGYSVAPAGDVNGDGGADIIVGAPAGKNTDVSKAETDKPGAAHIVFGAANPREGSPIDRLRSDPGAERERRLDRCFAASNVHVMMEDNGYTDNTADPERIRRQMLETYVSKPRNFGSVLGVTGFDEYDAPDPIFQPIVIADSEGVAPIKALRDKVDGKDSFPGYGQMIRSLAIDNPSAQARILLVDGFLFKDVKDFEGLTEGSPRTYVVAFGGTFRRSDGREMKKLAKQTKGKFYSVKTGLGMQKALNAIESRLRCDLDLERFRQVVKDEGDRDVNEVGLEDGAHSADILVNWPEDRRDRFEIAEIEVVRGGDVVQEFDSREIRAAYRRDGLGDVYGGGARTARIARAGKPQTRRVRRLIGNKGRSFRNIRLRGLRSGRLRVKVRAKRVHGKRGTVYTQITQSRRRY